MTASRSTDGAPDNTAAGPVGSPGHAGTGEDPPTPSSRFGWLLWATWLVFLAFPLLGALDAERPAPARWATAGLILVFGGLYALGSMRLAQEETLGRNPASWRRLGLVTALALATVPVLGLGSLGLVPFLQSFALFALPRPWNWWWSAAGLTVAVVATLMVGPDDDLLILPLIILGVSVGAGAGRLMSDHGTRYAAVQEVLAVTADRERVARDVHDVLGHSLTVVTVKAELAERLVDRDPERARAELREIQALARQALAEVRATVGGLRIVRLPDELAKAAEALASSGIIAELPDDPAVLDPRHRPVAAWMVREAVTNVVRHSGAGRCRVTVESRLIRVSDDGHGIDGSTPGNGLRGLRERVEQAGGELIVGPGPDGAGTSVEVRW